MSNFVYDEEGNWVECDECRTPLVWEDGQYYCPTCEEYWSRETFFDYIGAELPGDECLTCDNCYPGCIVCPYGYEDEDEDF